MSVRTLAIILGAGRGTGKALALAFSLKHHATALLARNAKSLDEVTDSIRLEGASKGAGVVKAFSCDTTSSSSIELAFKAIAEEFPGHILKVAVFNANSPFIYKPFMELTEADMKVGIDLNVLGAFKFSQKVVPLMLEHGGSLIFSGATASTKGSANFAGFAPAKFALRGLSQSLAREFGSKGIHVSHTILDGLIETPSVVERFGAAKVEGTRMDTADIADAYVYLSEQKKSCWTQELDLRPAAEKF